MSLAGPNCWVPMLAKFTDALVASTSFRGMVGLTDDSADSAVRHWIFGNRVTHSKAGRVWTRDELLHLKHYAAVLDDPDAPYGKHPDPRANACFRPHGTAVIGLQRLIVDAQLIQDNDGKFHTTDEHDEQLRTIAGNVLSEMLEWMIENGGPKIQSVNVVNVTTTRATKGATQGFWQGVSLVWSWSED